MKALLRTIAAGLAVVAALSSLAYLSWTLVPAEPAGMAGFAPEVAPVPLAAGPAEIIPASVSGKRVMLVIWIGTIPIPAEDAAESPVPETGSI